MPSFAGAEYFNLNRQLKIHKAYCRLLVLLATQTFKPFRDAMTENCVELLNDYVSSPT